MPATRLDEAIAHHAAGRLADAADLYARIPAGDPAHARALHLLGLISAQQGDFRRAVDLIGQSLTLNPADGAAHYDRGLAFRRLGENESAVACFDSAIALRPGHAETYSGRGLALQALGRSEDAAESFRRALEVHPQVPEPHYNLGITLQSLGRRNEAVDSYGRALTLQPGLVPAYYNRAAVLRELGRSVEALEDYDEAIRLRPDFAAAHTQRAITLLALARPEDALEGTDRAIEIDSQLAEAWLARGLVLLALRHAEDALPHVDRAIELKPEAPEAWIARGQALLRLGRSAEGLESLERAVALAPGNADAHLSLFPALEATDPPRALESLLRAKSIDPDRDYVDGSILHLKLDLCAWQGLEHALSKMVADIGQGRRVAPPFTVLAAIDDPEVQRKGAEVFVSHRHPPNPVLGPLPRRRRAGPIRVGYFSGDFRQHAVSHLAAAIFEAHDRRHFHPMGFAFGPRADDDMQRRVRDALQPFTELHDRSDVEAARIARELALDIAVDLGGFTQHARIGILAARAAPIQVAYLGYLGSTGAPYIDYLLADEVLIPEPSRVHYSEKIAYLPGYQTSDRIRITEAPGLREELGIEKDAVVFCCLNNPYKISPSTFHCWMRILGKVKRGILLLSEGHPVARANLMSEAMRCGIHEERLRFVAPTPRPQYLARLAGADIFLDTNPYSAGTLANDAAWAGLPVVTRAGRSFAARMGASVLVSAGLPELVAGDESAYESMAVELATNPRWRAEARLKLERARRESLLFDAARFTRNLEVAFKSMVSRYEAGAPPDHIFVTR